MLRLVPGGALRRYLYTMQDDKTPTFYHNVVANLGRGFVSDGGTEYITDGRKYWYHVIAEGTSVTLTEHYPLYENDHGKDEFYHTLDTPEALEVFLNKHM